MNPIKACRDVELDRVERDMLPKKSRSVYARVGEMERRDGRASTKSSNLARRCVRTCFIDSLRSGLALKAVSSAPERAGARSRRENYARKLSFRKPRSATLKLATE